MDSRGNMGGITWRTTSSGSVWSHPNGNTPSASRSDHPLPPFPSFFPPFPTLFCPVGGFRQAQGPPRHGSPVYPFGSRTSWLLASRYKHIVKAFQDHPAPDTLVQERLEALARWGRSRAIVASFLYLGIAASVGSLLGQLWPPLEEASAILRDIAAITGTFAGIFTLAFLFLTRLLSQIEADILTLLLTRD